jgi:hypothetical protein
MTLGAAVSSASMGKDQMAWARDALARAKLTQRDVARAWRASESTVSRWLDGIQASDLPVSRAVQFANLVKLDIHEVVTRLGYPPDVIDEEQRPVTAENTPPIPTVLMTPGRGRDGRWQLLLHLELSPGAIARIITGLEENAADQRTARTPGS